MEADSNREAESLKFAQVLLADAVMPITPPPKPLAKTQLSTDTQAQGWTTFLRKSSPQMITWSIRDKTKRCLTESLNGEFKRKSVS